MSYYWFRRGHATVQHHQKVADKPIQGQLRHADAELTRNVYMQQVAPETYQAVADLESGGGRTAQGRERRAQGRCECSVVCCSCGSPIWCILAILLRHLPDSVQIWCRTGSIRLQF